jgi:drug/metabolite transporter (DMT)-like permease
MMGILLVMFGSFFEEASDCIGKDKACCHEESPFTMGFLNLFWGVIFFIAIIIYKNNEFVFSLDSLPTFMLRAFLEIIQSYITILAIIKADRTTFSFIRIGTIPLLLLVDLFLGYKIGYYPMAGMAVIILVFIIVFLNSRIKKNGVYLIIFTAINAVITISLYKYDITHYNSVAAEQLLIKIILLIFFFIFAKMKSKENPLKFLTKPIFFIQSISIGFSGIFTSYAYGFAPASVILTAERSFGVFWSLITGKAYFKEKHLLLKILIFLLVFVGLFLLAK